MEDDITPLSTRRVYANPWLSVREDRVRFADGTEGIYGVVEKPDSVLVVALHDNGEIELVEQFRYPVGKRLWELPQGSWPPARGAPPETVARGELAEETGLTAARMECLGYFHQAAGVINQGYHLFLATGLTEGPTRREVTEQDMQSRRLPLPAILTLIEQGHLADAPSIAALGLLRLRGRI